MKIVEKSQAEWEERQIWYHMEDRPQYLGDLVLVESSGPWFQAKLVFVEKPRPHHGPGGRLLATWLAPWPTISHTGPNLKIWGGTMQP